MQWYDVAGLTKHYPGAEVASSYGTPALKVRGKLFTRLRPEDDSLVLLGVAEEEKHMLIRQNPTLFHTTAHYDGYPAVLARLEPLSREQLRYFLDRRYRQIAGKRLLEAWSNPPGNA